jgi:hypothetical protein
MRNLVQRGRASVSASEAVLYTAGTGPGRGHLTGRYSQCKAVISIASVDLWQTANEIKGVIAIYAGALRWRFALLSIQYPVVVKHPMD